MPSSRPLHVTFRGVSKTYHSARGDVSALSGIDLALEEGEFVSLLGPSGCGKSTLLRCLAGLETVSAGEVAVQGAPVSGPCAGLGIVFQRDVLLDWRTVLDNALLPIELRHKSRTGYTQRALDLLAMLGLSQFAHRYPWELSGGMRQRAAICRALLDEPTLLLMDEPFGALDAFTRDQLNIELQRIWAEAPKTVLFVTHSIPEAILLSDRVAVMTGRPGRIEEIVEITLPRPRSLAARDTMEYVRYSGYIRSIFERVSGVA